MSHPAHTDRHYPPVYYTCKPVYKYVQKHAYLSKFLAYKSLTYIVVYLSVFIGKRDGITG